jgi:putative membrane protein
MNRRLVLLSAAATPFFSKLVSSAVAQTDPDASAPLDMGQHKRMTLTVGSLSLQMSHIAVDRTRNERVKQFAGFEVAEQTTLAQVLNNDNSPTLTPLPPPLVTALQQLRDTEAGPAFDRAYVLGQIQGHQQLFSIQQRFLNGQNTTSSDAVHVAMLARTAIQMHLTMLQDILNQVQG